MEWKAWRVSGSEPPNVVVLDLKLPGLSGKELCRSFKTEMPSVPIVVLSANADVDDKVVLLELGADDYVTKPFSPKELLARVRRAMRRNVRKTTSRGGRRSGVPSRSADFWRCGNRLYQHGSASAPASPSA